jgi:predicted short-subunit dehydrogenase-like oxidoreductase (DUF2520 family)
LIQGTVGILGLGAVGSALLGSCSRFDLPAVGWTRSWERREWWRHTTEARVESDLRDCVEASDLVLLCVDERAFDEMLERLVPLPPRTIAHTAGAHASSVLRPLAELGWTIGAFHPLRPIPASRPEAIDGATIAIEGHQAAVHRLAELAEQIGCSWVELTGGDGARDRYHAACALLSNGLVGLAARAEALLDQVTARPGDGRRAMRSLLEGTLENLTQGAPAEMLTGPVRRGDVVRVERHLDALEGEDRELYRELSRLLLPLVGQDLEPARRAALSRLLDRSKDEA